MMERLPILTVVMSAPLFLSVQLKRPPEFLQGAAFVIVWTWGLVAAVIVPVLIAIEMARCGWLFWHRGNRRSELAWHGSALLVAILAEAVFLGAR